MSRASSMSSWIPISRCFARSSWPSTGSSTSPRSIGVQLGACDVRVGLQLAVGEGRVAQATFQEVVAEVVGVHGGDVEQEPVALRQQRQAMVDRQVTGAELGPATCPGHRSRSSASWSPGSVADRASCAARSRASSSSPVHSSMNVFLNSSARTQPTRG